jgi:RimJ/RimL family protein N-acetyltransferase
VSLLRDVVEADLPILFEHQRDAEANRKALLPSRNWDEFTAHWQKIFAADDVTNKTVLFEGQVAGNVMIFNKDGMLLVGYRFGREFWGKGLATKALTELLTEFTARPLHAYVATSNLGSVRVLEKCGFTLVGVETEFDEAMGEEIEEALYVLEA